MTECIGLIGMILALSVIGWVIDQIVPGRMPYGWLGGIVAAVIGGLIGGLLFGQWGPSVTFAGWQLAFIPALLGGIIFGFVVRFIMGSQSRRSL
jgi:uncharacterized membrane protein YeaQ/YmgE (transglycosylase-associated protein family)